MRVTGEGPKPASVMLVGEAPGMEEERTGRPFCGKSGRELSRYLLAAGLQREDLYVTNLVKYRPPFTNGKQQPPTRKDVQRDEWELLQELAQVRPLWIMAVGRHAASYFLGKIDMETAHGLAFPPSVSSQFARAGGLQVAGTSLRVIPVYHPAAALHNPEIAPLVYWDIQRAGSLVRGEVSAAPPIDEWAGNERYSRGEVLGWLPPVDVVAVDTEGLPGRVWGLSTAVAPGTADVVLAAHVPGDGVAGRLRDAQRVVMHNALHDVPILREAGWDVAWERVDDTFLMAYCLRLVPKGLKALAKRYCGMQMSSYREVMGEAEERLTNEWLRRALTANECPLCEGEGKVQRMRVDGKGLKKSPEKCNYPGCDSGGLWPARLEPGWSSQRYLRRLRDDIAGAMAKLLSKDGGELEEEEDADAEGTGKLKARIEEWPDEVLAQLQAAVGALPEPTLDDVPEAIATHYSARDADSTLRIYPLLRQELAAQELVEAYQLDLSVLPVAEEMQRTGMRIDVDYFAAFSDELRREKAEILDKLAAAAGRRVNPGSGEQVAELLFQGGRRVFGVDDELEYGSATPYGFDLTPEKFTKTQKRGSTDDKTLEGLKLKYSSDPQLVECVDLILGYRVRDKILGTYAAKLPLLVDSASRIHTEIKPCRTATFRWASANPNLQNIPARAKGGLDLGKRVRQGFTATPGYVLGSWDFDQIEMRVLAWYSQDENLLRVFREGHDIHSMTAALVYRVPFPQFKAELDGPDAKLAAMRKDQRTNAKNIGFGVVYGVTARGLKAQMDLRGQTWSEEQCQELIDMYLYEAYPGVGRFMMDAHAEARSTGMVRSYFGHIRYVPSVHSVIPKIREEALRQAANFKIQCTAAELLKVAMRDLWNDGGEILRELGARWLMAVHDELLFEVPDVEVTRRVVNTLVETYMTNPVPLTGVHVGTSGKYAGNWSLLK